MVDAARGWRDKAIILLLAQSGVRTSMVCALKIKDIEGYESGWVLKRTVWNREQRRNHDLKGADTLCFGPETAEYISLMLEERATKDRLTPESWLFCGNSKLAGPQNSLKRRSINRIVHNAAEYSGLLNREGREKRHRIHAHSLRRYFNNALITARTPEIIRGYLMNHSIPPTKKSYFNGSTKGYDEVLKAYKKAYHNLRLKSPMLELQALRNKQEELERNLIELRIVLDQTEVLGIFRSQIASSS